MDLFQDREGESLIEDVVEKFKENNWNHVSIQTAPTTIAIIEC